MSTVLLFDMVAAAAFFLLSIHLYKSATTT